MRTLVTLSAVALAACGGTSGMDGGTGGGGGGTTGGGTGATGGRINGAANAIVAQGDRFIVAGSISTRDDDFQLTRMLADGGLDVTFADGGYATLTWPTYFFDDPLDAGFDAELKSDIAFAVALQGEKIIVAGTVASQGGQSGAYGVARFSANGQLDSTFGNSGQADVRFGPLVGGGVAQLAQRSDGKIYVGGFVARDLNSTNNTDFGVARFSADGALDTSFGTAGSVQRDFGKNEVTRNIAFQGNKVLLAGGDDFTVTRLNDDGSLDTSFGTAGVAKNVGGFAHNMKVLAGGQILVAGAQRRVGSDQPWDIKIVRYTAEGQLDASFATAGVAMLAFDGRQVSVLSLDELGDGRLIISMTAGFGTMRLPYGTVTRLSASGAVDTAFGTDGVFEMALDGLPLIGGVIPPSPNHGIVNGGTLHYVDTNTVGRVSVIYAATAL
ncbi:MAG: hypothetical protein ACO1OB_09115 [Archangium sp.]